MALVAVLLWGVSFVATKAAVAEISPVTLVVLRFGMGVVLLHALLALRGKPLLPPRELWLPLAGLGFLGVFVHQLLQAHGLVTTTATSTAWLVGTIPIWSALIAVVFQRQRLGPVDVLGLVVGFVGAVLVVTRGVLDSTVLALPATKGSLLIVASTINWAAFTAVGGATLRRLGPLRAMAGTMVAGWAMLLPFLVAGAGWRQIDDLSPTGWLAVTFLGIGCSGIAYALWFGALERLEPPRVAAFIYLEPLVALVFAAALLGERVGAVTVLGGLLVLAGVALVQHESPGAARRAGARDAT